jgi:protein-S-isoprenylcysteine O-methyltransferase Ste14
LVLLMLKVNDYDDATGPRLLPSPDQSGGSPKPRRSQTRSWLEPERLSARSGWLLRTSANLIGAIGAAYFARASMEFYLRTHRLMGAVLMVEQTWVVVAYLVRRPARSVSRRSGDWLLAFGGTFGIVLLRPVGAHPQWGVNVGLALQLLGLLLCIASFLSIGRSFGFAAADRGLTTRGAYAVVRHPIYGSYLFVQIGYVLQSLSVWNASVVLFVTACNVGRALVEERVLARSAAYEVYGSRVRWRLLPGVW